MSPVAAGGVVALAWYREEDGREVPLIRASDLEACQQRIAEMDVAVAQAVEFAEYVEQAARGTMVERAEYFLSQPYSQRLKMRLEKYDEAAQRLTAAQAEADRLRVDAERYQWWRDNAACIEEDGDGITGVAFSCQIDLLSRDYSPAELMDAIADCQIRTERQS